MRCAPITTTVAQLAQRGGAGSGSPAKRARGGNDRVGEHGRGEGETEREAVGAHSRGHGGRAEVEQVGAVGEPAQRGVHADRIGGDGRERRREADGRQRQHVDRGEGRRVGTLQHSQSLDVGDERVAAHVTGGADDLGNGRIGAVGMCGEELAEGMPTGGDERALVEQCPCRQIGRAIDFREGSEPAEPIEHDAPRGRGLVVEAGEVDRGGTPTRSGPGPTTGVPAGAVRLHGSSASYAAMASSVAAASPTERAKHRHAVETGDRGHHTAGAHEPASA